MTTVGSGRYIYDMIDNWGTSPAGWTFGPVSAVAADSQNRIYAFQRQDPPVLIFDRHGNYLNSWGSSAITDMHRPTDIYINAQGIAYVSEARPSVSILDASGNKLARWDSPSGHGLLVDSQGDIYLASVGAKSVTKYVHK
jgi:hypothetical protein